MEWREKEKRKPRPRRSDGCDIAAYMLFSHPLKSYTVGSLQTPTLYVSRQIFSTYPAAHFLDRENVGDIMQSGLWLALSRAQDSHLDKCVYHLHTEASFPPANTNFPKPPGLRRSEVSPSEGNVT